MTEQAKGVTAAIADTPAKLAARCSAFFALNLHLPLSAASRAWNRHKAGLVFVDGSHAYHYTRMDSETAFALVAEGGMVLWHDYGVWEGVTAALEELDAERKLGLRHIGGTSLVVWQCR